MHVIAAPSVASPSEIQERYLWAINEGIILATLFSKPAIVCEKMLFGKVLEKLSVVDHGGASSADSKSETSSQDADYLFCSDLLSYMLNAVCVCMVGNQSKRKLDCFYLALLGEALLPGINPIILRTDVVLILKFTCFKAFAVVRGIYQAIS